MHDLRFCFDLEFAKLPVQASDCLFELFNVELE